MPINRWARKVVAAGLLTGEESEENAIRIGKELSAAVAKAIPENDLLRDEELEDILEQLNAVEDCDELNYVLSQLYDWADQGKRLWLQLW
jgi:hypothetical protein